MQANLSKNFQIWDRHAHVNAQLSRRITSEFFHRSDTHHNTENDSLTFAMHYIED
jgi:hypothetical protein